MKKLLLLVSVLLVPSTAWTADVIAQGRSRPPELIVEAGTISGPLKDILDEAAKTAGLDIAWTEVPFARSIKDLQEKAAVIVPRVRKTAEREQFVTFIGPISEQKRHVHFIVKKGAESKLTDFGSLSALTIGTKRGSLYFDQFDADKSLKKTEVADDGTLAKMLKEGRVDTVIVSDKPAMEAALKAISFSDYAVANYQVDILSGNYYGIAKDGPLAAKAPALQDALKAMVSSARIKAIYQKYNLNPEEIAE